MSQPEVIESRTRASQLSVLGAVLLAALTLPLSFTGSALATPAIGRELGGNPVALTWITNAFMLTFGSLMMAAGALADQYGRKRVFSIGVGLFVAVSLGIGFVKSVWAVDFLRAAQGVGGAGALAAGSAALAQEFEGRARAYAFSLLGTTFGLGLAFGPVIAGWLIETWGWRSIFTTSTAIGVLALLFGVPRMRETRDPAAQGLDWWGAAAFTATLSLFTFGLVLAPSRGWGSATVLGLLIGSALALAAFVRIEKAVRRPMLDLTLFRFPRFVGVQLLPIATCSAYVVFLIILPLRFVGIEGRSEVQGGWLMLALSAPMLVVPPLAATLTRWFSTGVISGIGLIVAAAGLLWLGNIPLSTGYAAVAPMLIIGAGAGLPWGLMDGLSVSVVPEERSGMASGIFNTAKVAGEGIVLAVVSAALAGLIAASLQVSLPELAASSRLGEIAQRLTTGDLAQAKVILPGADGLLAQGYLAGFRSLTQALAVMTASIAALVFWLLGGKRSEAGRRRGEAVAAH